MVAAESSGVAFTANPVTGDRSRVMIEAAFGQGEVVVGGRVEPDTYTVQKAPRRLLEEHIGVKSHKIVAGPEGDVTVALDPQQAAERVLLPAAVLDDRGLAIAVEDHYGVPMDIEWCDRRRRCAAARPGPSGHGARHRPAARVRAPPALCSSEASAPRPVSTGGPRRVLRTPVRGRLVARRRGPRRADDESRLAAHPAPRRRCRHRQWRDHLSRRDREPRARRPVRRRCAHGHHALLRDGERRHRRRHGRDRRPRRPAAIAPATLVVPRAPPGRPLGAGRPAPSSTSTSRSPSQAEEAAALDVDGVGLLRAEFLRHRRPGRPPPASVARHRRPSRPSSTPMAASLLHDHARLRAPARRVPHDRLPQQRVPRSRRRRARSSPRSATR